MQLRLPWSSITIPVHKLVAVCAGERGWCVPVWVVTLVRVCAGAARGIGRAWRCRGCLGAGPLPAQFKPLGPIMASFGRLVMPKQTSGNILTTVVARWSFARRHCGCLGTRALFATGKACEAHSQVQVARQDQTHPASSWCSIDALCWISSERATRECL